MKIKINGTKYELTSRSGRPVNLYYKKKMLVDNVKFDRLYNMVALVDGQVVGVLPKRYYILIAFTILCAVCTLTYFANYMNNAFEKEKVSDTTIDTGIQTVPVNEDIPVVKDIVLLKYNKFMIYNNGKLDIRFINGSHDATLTIEADGVECEPVEIKPEEELPFLSVTMKSKEEVIAGKLLYTYDDKTLEYQIVIENIVDDNENIDEDITLQDEEVIYE